MSVRDAPSAAHRRAVQRDGRGERERERRVGGYYSEKEAGDAIRRMKSKRV